MMQICRIDLSWFIGHASVSFSGHYSSMHFLYHKILFLVIV